MTPWPAWPPRDWRMLLALFFLAVAGAGAWLLAKWALDSLVMLATALGAIWPLAYYSYGALMLLGIPSLGFAMVVGLKAFSLTGPGGTSASFTGEGQQSSPQPTVTTTTETVVNPPKGEV